MPPYNLHPPRWLEDRCSLRCHLLGDVFVVNIAKEDVFEVNSPSWLRGRLEEAGGGGISRRLEAAGASGGGAGGCKGGWSWLGDGLKRSWWHSSWRRTDLQTAVDLYFNPSPSAPPSLCAGTRAGTVVRGNSWLAVRSSQDFIASVFCDRNYGNYDYICKMFFTEYLL